MTAVTQWQEAGLRALQEADAVICTQAKDIESFFTGEAVEGCSMLGFIMAKWGKKRMEALDNGTAND